VSVKQKPHRARAGDWLEAQGVPGCPARRGQILDVLGAPGHERYRVRWDEQHQSICCPSAGVVLLSRDKAVQSQPRRRA